METELKTLKDLPLDKRAKKILSLIAVKWYKSARGNPIVYREVKLWIKYFFDLQEEKQEEKIL